MLAGNVIRTALLCSTLGLPALQAAEEEQWHFVVSNRAESRVTKLETSRNGNEWRDFDIGNGIGPGKFATLVWAGTNKDETCHQWLRATFNNGTYSEVTKQDFCRNLDVPIEFSE